MLNDINLNGTPGAKVFFSSETFATGMVEISTESVTVISDAIGGIIIDAGGNVFAIIGFSTGGSIVRVKYITTLAGTGGGGGIAYTYYKTYNIYGISTSSTGSAWGFDDAPYTYMLVMGSCSVFSNTEEEDFLNDLSNCYGTGSATGHSNYFPFSGFIRMCAYKSSAAVTDNCKDYVVLSAYIKNSSTICFEIMRDNTVGNNPTEVSFSSITVNSCKAIKLIG